MTDEEQRALAFNLSRERQAQYCKIRQAYLVANPANVKTLTDRLLPFTKGESSEQRNKIKYNERLENIECKGIVN